MSPPSIADAPFFYSSRFYRVIRRLGVNAAPCIYGVTAVTSPRAEPLPALLRVNAGKACVACGGMRYRAAVIPHGTRVNLHARCHIFPLNLSPQDPSACFQESRDGIQNTC